MVKNELQLQAVREYIYFLVTTCRLNIEELVAYIEGRMLSEAHQDKQVE